VLRVYVAAPYGQAGRVRELHKVLESIGCKPVSYWAEVATDAEKLSDSTHRVHRAAWQINADAMSECDTLLALSEENAGGEFFAEIGRALHMGKPVLWTGTRRVLSCYAPGVVIESCVDTALQRLAMAARAAPSHYRDAILARYVGPHCPRCKMEGVISAKFADGSPAWECRYCNAIFARLEAVPVAKS
jgi:hypothetical protein